MTRKVFWEDPYLTQLETQITSIKENDITVAQTIFYAFSGAQESDAGTIGNHRVLEAHKADREIVYTLEAEHRLNAGDLVKISVDWARRYRLMRLHFAAEIILALVYQQLPAIQKIGAHIAQDKARIDFEWAENISAMLPAIKDQAAAIVAADHDIVSAFSDEAQERRYWEISGFARIPCGGTHLRKTSEVGAIALKRKNVGKNKERIEIYFSEDLNVSNHK